VAGKPGVSGAGSEPAAGGACRAELTYPVHQKIAVATSTTQAVIARIRFMPDLCFYYCAGQASYYAGAGRPRGG
ncbi:MAG: hypothetical protein CSH49_12595, partial [Alcanivorax sp.]